MKGKRLRLPRRQLRVLQELARSAALRMEELTVYGTRGRRRTGHHRDRR